MLITILLFIAGLILLIAGAEILVRGASKLALTFGISPLIVGLTVVAYGTSAPEVAVSISSSLNGQPDIAIGNLVGSNIANVLLILGLSALFAPLVVSRQLIVIDVPIMIGLSVLVLLMGLDGIISTWDGFILFAGAIVYTVFLIRKDKEQVHDAQDEDTKDNRWWLHALLILSGLGLLVLGSNWLVDGAVYFARLLGLSELIIGLTIIAIGTSLPELATSIIASIKGQRDIAVGNVVGSNIFNILSVLGLSSIVVPNGIPVSDAVLGFDLPVMIAVAVACLPIFFQGHSIDRWEGGLFLAYYVAYTAYLVLAATSHDLLPVFNLTMLWFILPLTAITLGIITWRAFHAGDYEKLRLK